jgi:hypothetical protein
LFFVHCPKYALMAVTVGKVDVVHVSPKSHERWPPNIVSPKQNGRLRVTLLFPEPGQRALATASLVADPCLDECMAAA